MGYRDNPGNAVIESYVNLEALDRAHIRHLSAPQSFSNRHPVERQGMVANVLPYLLAEAEKSREFALSYRDFRVGVAALVLYWREGVEHQMYVHGANMKPTPADDINIHGEHVVLRSIERYLQPGDEATVPALVVIGDYQNDQQSGRQTRTLHPCGVCREDFTSFERPSFADTLFVTARADMRTFEMFTLARLNALHEGDPQQPAYAEFDHSLDIFGPPEQPGATRSDEFSDDERLFDAMVRIPILMGAPYS